MRTIKFRAWENGEMYYQVRCGGVFDGIPTAPTCWNEVRGEWLNLTGQPFTKVMQFTGITDINGKEIYEGDILGCESSGVNRFEIRVVCWDSYQAKFKSVPLSTYHSNAGNGGWTGYELYRTYCEVIGNIYENPELLRGDSD